MRQLQLVAHGELSDVIELNRVSEPALGHDDVLVSMKAAPIHCSCTPTFPRVTIAFCRTTAMARFVAIACAERLQIRP
jgi:hypothetical protein